MSMEFKKIERQFVPPQNENDLAEEAKKPLESLSPQDEISSAYENRDLFQVVDQVSTLELGEAVPGGEGNVIPNQEFPDLFQRFVESVSEFDKQQSNDELRFLRKEPHFKKPDE